MAALTWLLDPTGPTVRLDLGAPPETGAGWLQPIALGLLLVSVLTVIIHRRRSRAAGGPGLVGLRSFTLGAAVGNALLDLGGMLTPDRPSAGSIQDLEEEPVDDALGDGREPPSAGLGPYHPPIELDRGLEAAADDQTGAATADGRRPLS